MRAAENETLNNLDVAAFTSKFILTGLGGVSPEAITGLGRRKRAG